MDKTLKIYLAAILLAVVLVFVIDAYRVKPLDWTPSYSLDKKKPLDLYVFNREIKAIIPEKRLKRVLVTNYEYLTLKKNNNKAVYLVIQPDSQFSPDSILLDEVAKGSVLFYCSQDFPKYLTDTLGVEYADVDPQMSLKTVDKIGLKLSNKGWGRRVLEVKPVQNTFSFVKLNKKTTTILGTETMPDGVETPDFVRISFGKGFIYLHNQPQVFSNIALLDKNSSAEYVAHLLTYLPHNLPVVWFVHGQSSDPSAPVTDTPLSVVFRYPALRAAWLLMIYGLLIYIFFNAKRRQRPIPVIRPLPNTTVEFVQTIGNLYRQQGSPANIVQKKIIYFLDRIRNTYYLDTAKLDERFAEKLQSKSGKSRDQIDEILSFISKFKEQKKAESKDLIYINKLIEDFWRK